MQIKTVDTVNRRDTNDDMETENKLKNVEETPHHPQNARNTQKIIIAKEPKLKKEKNKSNNNYFKNSKEGNFPNAMQPGR